MTLEEMSLLYAKSAALIHARILELQAAERKAADSETALRLHQRISQLLPLLRECRELASWTAHYYDRGFSVYEKYKF